MVAHYSDETEHILLEGNRIGSNNRPQYIKIFRSASRILFGRFDFLFKALLITAAIPSTIEEAISYFPTLLQGCQINAKKMY
jgi:hypothetical protein